MVDILTEITERFFFLKVLLLILVIHITNMIFKNFRLSKTSQT